MFQTSQTKRKIAHWQRFSRRSYSVFRSVRSEFAIGVLTVATLVSATRGMAESYSMQPANNGIILPDDGAGSSVNLDGVEIIGSMKSLAAGRAARVVSVITREDIAASAAQSLVDILKEASGVDVRQRGGFGVQTDVSIDGGTADQVTILLNGVNISSAQTGHYSADWPVDVNDIERIEILEGASSRIMGGSSLMGGINIVTRCAKSNGAAVTIEGGQHGTVGGNGKISIVSKNLYNQLSGGYRRSDGGTINSAFHRGQAFYQGKLATDKLDVDWQAGMSVLDHGANTFYSAAYPNQHDALNRYLVSVSANTKGRVRLEPMAYWERLADHYQLVKDSNFGENFHRNDVYGGRLNASVTWKAGITTLGSELRHERIISTSLGIPFDEVDWKPVPGHDDVMYNRGDSRTHSSFYLEHNVSLGALSMSGGLVATRNTGMDTKYRVYPGVDISWLVSREWRVYASWSKAYRMPTFTDLYYKSVVIEGNRDLKPEEVQTMQIGSVWRNSSFGAKISGFYHKGHNMIDWVMYHPDDIFHSTGFDLDNMGFSVQGEINFQQWLGESQPLKHLNADYTFIHQNRRDKTEIYKSNYALEYLRHKLTMGLEHKIWCSLTATWSLRWQDRMGSYLVYENAQSTGQLKRYSPYAVLDLKLNYALPHWNFSIKASNLTNHRYYDYGNIPQPGLWVMAYVTYFFPKSI